MPIGALHHILICDDDEDTCLLIEQILTDSQLHITKVHSGAAAMEVCRAGLPDVIVLDIMMPEISGTDFLKWFRSTYSEAFVPVLILTALSQNEDKVHGLELGADDYLTKPFHHRELRARVQGLLRIKELTERLRNAERQLVAGQLAGAAAHTIGQSITTILLHCRMLEKENSDNGNCAVASIKKECAAIEQILQRISLVDASKTTDYVGGEKILSLESDKKTF